MIRGINVLSQIAILATSFGFFAHTVAAQNKQLYTCGMHPQMIKNEPGVCPICGMQLVPSHSSKHHTNKRSKENAITIDPVVVQNMGVRVAPVKRGDLSRAVRTVGEVIVAEDLVSVVNLKFSGWIEKLYVDQTGVKVRKGQPLFRIYSPELVSAQKEYLLTVRSSGAKSPIAESTRTKLAFWDLGKKYLDRIISRGKVSRTLTIRAPRAGYVLHKSVVQGARVLAGEDLFRIGKLSSIWVQAQIYEFDAPWVKLGQHATMELSFQRGRLYEGRVSYIYPTLNMETRTLKLRLEFTNPELRLKPGMFTTVRIRSQTRNGVLSIPTEAILYSGRRLLVFVAKAIGRYEPREIMTGPIWRWPYNRGTFWANGRRTSCRQRPIPTRLRKPASRSHPKANGKAPAHQRINNNQAIQPAGAQPSGTQTPSTR